MKTPEHENEEFSLGMCEKCCKYTGIKACPLCGKSLCGSCQKNHKCDGLGVLNMFGDMFGDGRNRYGL